MPAVASPGSAFPRTGEQSLTPRMIPSIRYFSARVNATGVGFGVGLAVGAGVALGTGVAVGSTDGEEDGTAGWSVPARRRPRSAQPTGRPTDPAPAWTIHMPRGSAWRRAPSRE